MRKMESTVYMFNIWPNSPNKCKRYYLEPNDVSGIGSESQSSAYITQRMDWKLEYEKQSENLMH